VIYMPVSKEYIEAVTKLAKNKTNRRFLNDSGDHAKLLIDLMVGNSQEGDDVLIYSGELKQSCFEDALKTGKGNIRILLDDIKGLSVIEKLPESSRNRIEIKQIQEKDGNHFLVSGTSVRYELSHDDATAVANFNEPIDELQALQTHFNEMWGSAVGA
jgi:hypothetical protein